MDRIDADTWNMEIVRALANRLPPRAGAGPIALLGALLALWASAPARAEPPVGWDLECREVELNHWYRDWISQSLAIEASQSDSLGPRTRDHVLNALDDVERVCRTELLSKESEPGSPWLEWRSLGKVEHDTTAHWIGALSCTDILCGFAAPHERLAIVSVGPEHAAISILPAEDPTIHSGITYLKNYSVVKAENYAILVAEIEHPGDHPCWTGPEYSEGSFTYFVVLGGEGVTQAFRVLSSSLDVSADPIDGDSGGSLETVLTVSPEEILLDYRSEEWDEIRDGDEFETNREVEVGQLRFHLQDRRFERVSIGQ